MTKASRAAPRRTAPSSCAPKAGFRACETALLTHGGMGYSKEFDVERYLREVMLTRIAPISSQLILCFIAEKVLGLPKIVLASTHGRARPRSSNA